MGTVYKPLLLGWWPSPIIWKSWELIDPGTNQSKYLNKFKGFCIPSVSDGNSVPSSTRLCSLHLGSIQQETNASDKLYPLNLAIKWMKNIKQKRGNLHFHQNDKHHFSHFVISSGKAKNDLYSLSSLTCCGMSLVQSKACTKAEISRSPQWQPCGQWPIWSYCCVNTTWLEQKTISTVLTKWWNNKHKYAYIYIWDFHALTRLLLAASFHVTWTLFLSGFYHALNRFDLGKNPCSHIGALAMLKQKPNSHLFPYHPW